VSQEEDVTQFATGSLDGHVFFWDMRFKRDLKALDLVWKPLFKLSLASVDGGFEYGSTSVNLFLKCDTDSRQGTITLSIRSL
jgi:hypothetical protein